MKNYVHHSEYFYGHKISDYGLDNGYIDYRTLSQAFDMVLNNDIIKNTSSIGYWEEVNGSEYYEDENGNEYFTECYQYYIISNRGYQILSELTDEIIWYNDQLDMYVWGIAHWGTSWDYVLTNIKIDLSEN